MKKLIKFVWLNVTDGRIFEETVLVSSAEVILKATNAALRDIKLVYAGEVQ